MDALLLVSGICFHLRKEWRKRRHVEVASVMTALVVLEQAEDPTVVLVAFLHTLLAVLDRSTSFPFEVLETIETDHGLGPAAVAVVENSVAEPYTAESTLQSCSRGCLRRFQQRSSGQGVAEYRLAWTPEAWIAQSCVARVSTPLAWSSPLPVFSCPPPPSPLANSSYHLQHLATARAPAVVSLMTA
jgi:hypothetical protein